MDSSSKVTQRLRGKIKGGEVGSRGISTYLTSPCQRARSIVAVGASMENAANFTHKVEIREEPSKIAALVGRIFEDELVRNDGANLVRLYKEHPRSQMVLKGAVNVFQCDLEMKTDDMGNVTSVDGKSIPSYLVKKNESVASNELLFRYSKHQMFSAIENDMDQDTSLIFLQPTFQFDVNGFTHHIRPDFLLLDRNVWRVGEIKVYLDRDGETSGLQVASTVKQAAVGILAVEQSFTKKDFSFISEKNFTVAKEVDVVFRRHGSHKATVTRLNAQAEVESLHRGLAESENIIKSLAGLVTSIDSPEIIEAIPNHYTLDCASTCPYDSVCKKQKTKESGRVIHHHPGVMASEHAGINGERALQLAEGDPPETRQESVVARWLHAGWEQKI